MYFVYSEVNKSSVINALLRIFDSVFVTLSCKSLKMIESDGQSRTYAACA